MDSPYTPISCACYDQLEVLAMRKAPTVIVYRDNENKEQEVATVIVDVYSKDKQEFLKLDNDATIRLDRLMSVDGKLWSNSCGT